MDDAVDVAVVGGGLAGLSCAFELAEQDWNVSLFEARDVVGGRTSSWSQDGMPVESGLHRFLGYFKALIGLMERCGVDVDEAVCWEDEIEIRVPEGPWGIFGLSPHRPLSTLRGIIRNNDVISPADKASLVPFLLAGVRDYAMRPARLDRYTVAEYARRHRVRPRALDRLLTALTAGTFFLGPERFSAFYFFGLLTPGLPRLHRMRLGAFNGGMTEVMTGPIADAIEQTRGQVRTGVEVRRLLRDGRRIVGIQTSHGTVEAREVVLATSLAPAQRLIRTALPDHPWFQPLLALPTTPSSTLQLELDAPITDVDRTTFAPGTILPCFAEQSRTTFQHVPGRLSIILSPPERFVDRSPQQVLDDVLADAKRVGLDLADHVTDYRVIVLPHDFHALEPGHMGQRPRQSTPVDGLTLAGDYTQQRFVSTMEGAVVSGQRAAGAVQRSLAA